MKFPHFIFFGVTIKRYAIVFIYLAQFNMNYRNMKELGPKSNTECGCMRLHYFEDEMLSLKSLSKAAGTFTQR